MSELNLTDVKSIIQSLKDGIKEYRNSVKYKEMLDTMAKFYHYSYGNSILISSQKPEATYCGSMKFWNSLGRYISKGEHGIKILCPNPRIETYEIKDKEGNPVLDENGEPKTKKIEYVTFSIGNTFDISQTYGKELNLQGKELIGEGLNKPEFFKAMQEIANVNEIKVQPIKGGAKGYFDLESNEIVVKEGMSDLQTTKTVVHETAHAVVFSDEELAKTLDRSEHEIVAESVAYVVCKRFGLDTSEYSFDYVNGWARSNDETIEKCIETISITSRNIITKMEEKLGLKQELDIKKENFNSIVKSKENKQVKTKSKQKGMKK